MNTSVLKVFAPAVRRTLQDAVSRKLDVVLAAQTPDYRTTFAPQVAALRNQAALDRDELVERVAYTWFNRLAALRYLDARGWHPFNVRVLTPSDPTATQPELLKQMREGALPEALRRFTDPARLDALLDGNIPSAAPQTEVYRHLVLAACRYYHALLPGLFERLDDSTELLLPDDLLTEQSVVAGFRSDITDEDCADVEVLGWLYQFYISEKKGAVMARKGAVPAEDIPAVTQLFTPHWIVRYLVENSLGRLWLLNRPGSRLREHMPYYIDVEPETDFLKIAKPEEIRVCDPAVGSGHMLTYAFDLLSLIYEEEGYAPAEIPALILRHNLYGIDIDARAAQLAELALVFKAREKSRRFFQPAHLVRPHIVELQDVRFTEAELRDYISALDLGALFSGPLIELFHQFAEAKSFGSLIQPGLDEQTISATRRAIDTKELSNQLFLSETHLKVMRVLDQAEALTRRYHVVVANPPYLSDKYFSESLKSYAREFFRDSRFNLYSMFMSRAVLLLRNRGKLGMITLHSWMSGSKYQAMRERLVQQCPTLTMAHLGAGGFDSIDGQVVSATAFVMEVGGSVDLAGKYLNLTAETGEVRMAQLVQDAANDPSVSYRFSMSGLTFNKVPGSPFVYWISDSELNSFATLHRLDEYADFRQGMATTDNDTFLRRWTELSRKAFVVGASSANADEARGKNWFPYNKGGGDRRWYGHNDFAVRYANDGNDLIELVRSKYPRISDPEFVIKNRAYYFRPSVTYSALSGGAFAARLSDQGFIFDTKGSCAFPRSGASREEIASLLNSCVASAFLRLLAPTLDFNLFALSSIPFPNGIPEAASAIAQRCLALAKADWDNFETSWDFRDLPLLRPGLKGATLEASWRNWEAHGTAAIRQMQSLETENNRLFIAAYGLEGELQSDVGEAQVTLARADAQRDIAAFLSYAVGCMMGRYSPDNPGLILANAGDSLSEFLERVGKQLEEITFAPDEDGIVPVLDGEWFEDDIVARTRDFLRATFGEASLRENLRFIEDSLGRDLRKYFLTDFYKDHLQTYKKRPIYWLVQSPKKGFSALLYMHRYSRDTLNVVLNRYLREYQGKLRSRLAQLAQALAGDDLPARDRTAARKEQDRLTKVLHECEEWERSTLLPLAQQRIELDLDNGVKVNYLTLARVLAPIPGLTVADE